MLSLAVKYRPTEFEKVCSQKSIIKILNRQLELKEYSNCYMFSGPSGTGKTTIARIFANKINNNIGEPIEIDAASNNGVDNIRSIISEAKERSLVSEYKIFIIDEAHMITTAGWNAFLKCIEEPPKHTIFIFCTTNPEKVPITIQNRLMRFNLSKVPVDLIEGRLEVICLSEKADNYREAIQYISKIANGSLREAISNLEKCLNYNKDLRMENILECLGVFSYSTLFDLTNFIMDGKDKETLTLLESIFKEGKEIETFVNIYLDFILDLYKYCLFSNLKLINIPSAFEKDLKYTTGVDKSDSYFSWFLDKLLDIKNAIKHDSNSKTTLEIMILNIIRGWKW